VGLWSLLTGWQKSGKLPLAEQSAADDKGTTRRLGRGRVVRRDQAHLRRGRFETLEDRRLMDADPLKVGVTYLEEDSGSDLHGDTFEILFEGGASGTELTQLIIDGDHGTPGLSVGDMIFDTIKGGLGADDAFNLQIVSSTGIQEVTWQVSDGGSKLIFNFKGFNAGEKLVFSVDVDEVQDYDAAETNLQLINEGLDPIASGVEFQGSMLTASFKAPHYRDVSGTGEFRNIYDPLFTGSNLLKSQGNANGLRHDDYEGKRDRSTGVMVSMQQVPLPVSIGGKVFADNDRDLVQDAGEQGLAGVTISLWKKVGGVWQNTGNTTQTNAQGEYRFGTNLNLMPGTYQVREVQPAGYFSVGAIPGRVSGTPTGSTVAGDPDVLTEIQIPLGDQHGVNYDFAEAQPASIRGRVHLTDAEGNCFSEEALNRPLAGVKITLKDAQGNVVAVTETNASGEYSFTNLLPGTYTIVEETPAGLLDGGDHIGTIGGVKVGQKSANDTISNIVLLGGQDGVNYDFCEHEPAMVAGFVYYDKNNNGIFEANEAAIPGTTVILLDASGQQVAQTVTDNFGAYKFTNLHAGNYTICEVQPTGYIDGKDTAGTISGTLVGTVNSAADKISSVNLLYGQSGINYNFGELKPGSVAGRVWVDVDEDCIFDASEQPLAGVTIQLLDVGGNVIKTTTTNAQGQYSFTDLAPGTYAVRELQPAGYLQGGQKAGSHGGNASVTDMITELVVGPEDALIEYDFCELLPVSLAGLVWNDPNANCVFETGEKGIAGVTIRLYDSSGNLVASTLTGSDGRYQFDNLRPGEYTVRESQPAGYFDGGEKIGSHGGDNSQNDQVAGIVLRSGDAAVNYDFCERPPALLSGYVFRDGAPIITFGGEVPDNLYEIRDGKLTSDDLRLKGVILELRHTLTGEPVRGEELLPGLYGSGPVRVVTDANGYYEFRGLPQGNYSIFQVHPDEYIDSIDTPGTTSGLAVNLDTLVSPLLVQTFAQQGVSFEYDAILQVPLAYGQHSQMNNFSEVEVQPILVPAPLPEEVPPELPIIYEDLFQPPPIIVFPEVFIPQPAAQIVTGGSSNFTWHLSVVDAGLPRVSQKSTRVTDVVWRPAMFVERAEWQASRLRAGIWTIHASGEPGENAPPQSLTFGIPGARPVTGDWNGDGRAELGLFYNGEWFLDLNGNGVWDAEDLWCKLGAEGDKPVVGDWDGDGKDDIGVFGPEWAGDPRHIEHEPGLPDSANPRAIDPEKQRPKNPPPNPEHATDGERLMRLGAKGRERADLIDHVFRFGGSSDLPIAGDWNGDGIRSVGLFRNGKWHFDMDGDGRWSEGDQTAIFGQEGDIPVVGDFNGDGIEEIGVFRAGKWIIDTNGNRQIDADDLTLDLGAEGDLPVVGDFNGDGQAEPGVYRGQEPGPADAEG
jgi:serine-aspartate repeat-containing protein C/D/E